MNKVMLIGNVGKDPQVRYLDGGLCIAQVNLATTEKGYTLPNGTTVPDRTEWHNCVFWRKLAEIVEKYVRKGDKLYVEGKIQTRTWDDKQGVKRYAVEIIADNMEMLTPKRMDDNASQLVSQPSPQTQGQEPVRTVQPTPAPKTPPVVTPMDNGGEYPF